MKKGFTLLELMVASLLLAMLVTILTMIFNQSSIAWTVGTASVRGLGEVRRDMAIVGQRAENVIDPQNNIQVISVWNPDARGLNLRHRTLDNQANVNMPGALPRMEDPAPNENPIPVGSGNSSGGKDTYLVGVLSYGPDGKTGGDNSWDDITTMPEEE